MFFNWIKKYYCNWRIVEDVNHFCVQRFTGGWVGWDTKATFHGFKEAENYIKSEKAYSKRIRDDAKKARRARHKAAVYY